jgi:hypothetical protein
MGIGAASESTEISINREIAKVVRRFIITTNHSIEVLDKPNVSVPRG